MAKDTDKVDELDRKILDILSTNVRIPFKGVATQCGVSRVATHQRVQHLVEKSIIMGGGFYISPKSLGYSTCTYVDLNPECDSTYKRVIAGLQEVPEIIECHFTTGPYTMMIKLHACDNKQLMDLLNNRMQAIPGVINAEISISLEQSIRREVPANVDEE